MKLMIAGIVLFLGIAWATNMGVLVEQTINSRILVCTHMTMRDTIETSYYYDIRKTCPAVKFF